MQDDLIPDRRNSEALELSFSIAAQRQAGDWEKNHICAEYLADYANQTLGGLKDKRTDSELYYRVSYITNELLEAAMLSLSTPTGQIWVQLQLTDENIFVNVKSEHGVDNLTYLNELVKLTQSRNPNALYMERLRHANVSNSDNFNNLYSDIRFLSMIVDWDAKFDFMIGGHDPNDTTLSVLTRTSVPVA